MQINAITGVKWYYDQKITFIFSSDFETMFTKHSRSVILSLKEEDRLFKLQFSVLMVRPLLHQKGYNYGIHSRAVECSV